LAKPDKNKGLGFSAKSGNSHFSFVKNGAPKATILERFFMIFSACDGPQLIGRRS
jgi:hypothetical protein